MTLGSEHDRLRGLASTARLLASLRALPPLLERAAEEALSTLRAASVSVSRLQPGGLVVRTIVNVGDLGPGEVRWPVDETYLMEEFADLELTGDGLVTWVHDVDDPQIPPDELALLQELEKAHSVSAPVVVDGMLWGEIYATRRRGEPAFAREDVSYLEVLQAILAGAISRVTREETLAELAFRDPLTGLPNRRALDERAASAFTVAPGDHRRVVAVAVDINGLKLTNDTQGHDAGDRLIQAVASSLLTGFSLFPEHLVARVGGDEFTVLVADQDLDEVVRVADEVAADVRAQGWGQGLSCGAAALALSARPDHHPSELFAAADRAQYVAKRAGAATTRVASDLDSPAARG